MVHQRSHANNATQLLWLLLLSANHQDQYLSKGKQKNKQSNSELKKKAKVKVKIIPKEIETATLHMVPETDIAVVVTTVVGIAELMFRY